MLGYQDRSAPLRAEWAERIVPGNNGIFQPTIVVNGLVVGPMASGPRAKRVRFAPEWFMGPTAKSTAGSSGAQAIRGVPRAARSG